MAHQHLHQEIACFEENRIIPKRGGLISTIKPSFYGDDMFCCEVVLETGKIILFAMGLKSV